MKDVLPDTPHLKWLKRDMTWCHSLQDNKLIHFKCSDFLKEESDVHRSVLARQLNKQQLEEKENAVDSKIKIKDSERVHESETEIEVKDTRTTLSSIERLGIRRRSGYYSTCQCAVFWPKYSGKHLSGAVTGRSVDFWRRIPWEARVSKRELCQYIDDNYATLRPKSGLMLQKLKNGTLISQREAFRRKRASKPEKSPPGSSRRRARATDRQ